MKIARYAHGSDVHFGVLEGDRLARLSASPFDGQIERTGEVDRRADARLLCPVARPRIFGVGFNYLAHIHEAGQQPPKIPTLFMKPDTAAVGPGEPIIYPSEGENVHFEAELAVVIGRRARRVTDDEAPSVILGYTCANDVSERVIQFQEMEMGCLLVGKAFDSFCPIGPIIATDVDPTKLRIRARVNGETRQDSHTSDLLFPATRLVSYLSQAITLLPGDVIITGTPAGVGPILPGDVVDIEIEGIGTLTNPVAAEGVT